MTSHPPLRLRAVWNTLYLLAHRRHMQQRDRIATIADAPTQPQMSVVMAQPAFALHRHAPRPHVVRNPNAVHAAERADLNSHIAVWLTSHVGTMLTAYTFGVLAFVGLFGVLNILPPIAYVLIAWLSQTFIQLVLLPVIMVGQNVLNRHAELQADEMFKSVQNTEHEEGQEIAHLSAQDAQILEQGARTRHLEEINRQQLALLLQLVGGNQQPLAPVPTPTPAPTPAPAPTPRRNKSRPAKASRRF